MAGAWPIIAGRRSIPALFSPRAGPGTLEGSRGWPARRSVVVAAALADRRGVGADGVAADEVEDARGHELAERLLVPASPADDLHRGDEGSRRGQRDEDETTVGAEEDAAMRVGDDAVPGEDELRGMRRVPGGVERVHREVVRAREL